MGNKKPDDFGSGRPFLSYKDVYSRAAFVDVAGLVESTKDDCERYSVLRGDAFFTGSSETIEELGFSSVCLASIPNATFNGFTIRFRPYGDCLRPEYSAYLFRSEVFRGYLRQRDNSITRANLSQQTLGDALVVLPTSEEQRAIAEYLDTKTDEIDELVADCEREIELLQEYRKAVISETVTKGLDPDALMKNSGVKWIGEIPEEWTAAKVLHGLSMPITDGPHETPIFYPDGIPFISAEAVSYGNGRIAFNHMRGFISEEYYNECCRKYTPHFEDILMIKSGATTGRVALVDTPIKFTIWSPLAAFRCDSDKLLPRYLFYFLQSEGFQKQIEDGWTYGTQQNIGMRTLEKLIVCYPSIAEQRSIAEFLDARATEIDEIIESKRLIVEKLREYRKSLISEAVTGKFKVPGVA